MYYNHNGDSMKGKLIVIEGTDCSGKETQTKLLIKRLKQHNIKCQTLSFPMYDTPTGRIVGGPFLGKSYICEGWFPETAPNVDPKVASLYYAADRRYHKGKIEKLLNRGINVILDRYTYSSFGHQACKLRTKKERIEMYNWLDKLEFEMLELPKADIKIFLHMPYKVACELKKDRVEALDQNEASKSHLLKAERTYLEVADLYDFKYIKCSKGNKPRKIEDINNELYEFVYNYLENKITNELINFDIENTNEQVKENDLELEENYLNEKLIVTN